MRALWLRLPGVIIERHILISVTSPRRLAGGRHVHHHQHVPRQPGERGGGMGRWRCRNGNSDDGCGFGGCGDHRRRRRRIGRGFVVVSRSSRAIAVAARGSKGRSSRKTRSWRIKCFQRQEVVFEVWRVRLIEEMRYTRRNHRHTDDNRSSPGE